MKKLFKTGYNQAAKNKGKFLGVLASKTPFGEKDKARINDFMQGDSYVDWTGPRLDFKFTGEIREYTPSYNTLLKARDSFIAFVTKEFGFEVMKSRPKIFRNESVGETYYSEKWNVWMLVDKTTRVDFFFLVEF